MARTVATGVITPLLKMKIGNHADIIKCSPGIYSIRTQRRLRLELKTAEYTVPEQLQCGLQLFSPAAA